MQAFLIRTLGVVLLLVALPIASCGGDEGRVLLSVTVTPSRADAQQFPNGQVQFTAKGTYNLPPTVVDPLPNVVWTVNRPAFSGVASKASDPTIDSNGRAQCSSRSQGTATVIATAAKDPSKPVSLSNEVTGSAQLMCR